MVNEKTPHSDSGGCFSETIFHDEGADLFEDIVHSARRDAVTFEIDESYLLEAVHNFVRHFSLF
jgi:hypothetical protein